MLSACRLATAGDYRHRIRTGPGRADRKPTAVIAEPHERPRSCRDTAREGMARTRLARMSSWISSLPPARRYPGAPSTCFGPREGSPFTAVGRQPRPEQLSCDLADPGHRSGPQQLADRAGGTRRSAGARSCKGAGGDQIAESLRGVDLGQPLADQRFVGALQPSGEGEQLLERSTDRARPTPRAARAAFEPERGQRDVPAVADRTQTIGIGNPDVGEEHLVERRAARHLADRSNADPGRVHREHECGQPAVLGNVEVGAGDQLAPFGEAGAGAPGLLAVDHPRVTVSARARVVSELRSDPAPGSENSWQLSTSVRSRRGRSRLRSPA